LPRKVLNNKPLVEAIFDMRWKLQIRDDGARIDPNYKLLVGVLYEKIKKDYPFHEELPTASLPDEISANIIQHRFRKAKDEWPLIQIGPGVLTINDTVNYVWEDFQKRIINLVSTFLDVYKIWAEPTVYQLILRYRDAIEFDFSKEDIYDFLKQKMKMDIGIYKRLFEDGEVEMQPIGFDASFSFKSTKPPGEATLRFTKGKKKDGSEGLVWDTIVVLRKELTNQKSAELFAWVEDAHNLTDKWFFMIIEGELEKRFE
jgi:uncharacterized protein (TIGR04255 family)